MNTMAARMMAIAGLVSTCALVALGAQAAGFSHLEHPVALAGAAGVPMATLFNTMVFVLPGILVILAAGELRAALPAGAGWAPRIGATLLQLSALGFAAQGLLPLGLDGIDAGDSRLHAVAWMAWWIAFAIGAPLFAGTGQRQRTMSALLVVLVLGLSLLASGWMPVGIGQRLAFATWFGASWWLARSAVSRGAASSPG